jgi:predicted ATPase
MHVRRIAVSGGPGAGKTTLWRELADLYKDRVIAVPEVATLLFAHVFPRVQTPAERMAVQRAIFAVQHSLELFYERRLAAGQILLCDRGSPDGAGYWPQGPDDFFATMNSAWQAELARYESVLFMESAAIGGLDIDGGNLTRTEDQATAAQLDAQLCAVWRPHARFVHVPHERDFAVKIAAARAAAERLLADPP